MNLAPVLIFCYKRLDTLKQTIAALQKNELSKSTELFIFSDGPKKEADKIIIQGLRTYLKSIGGFKSIVINESATNKGLANSIIDGVTKVLGEYDRVIVMEDDLLTTSNFLNFMNEALENYNNSSDVFSVSGYSFNLKIPRSYSYDVYFTKRSSSWGWATWRDRWEKVDWSMKNFENTNWTFRKILDFNKMGSDMYNMLKRQYEGKVDSWAIRFCFHQYFINGLTVFPSISKVQNIGFDKNATHTSGYNGFETILDTSNKTKYNFCSPTINDAILRQFVAKRGYIERIKGKLMTFFN
jgi:hypothetical protein